MNIKEILKEIMQCYYNNDLASDIWYTVDEVIMDGKQAFIMLMGLFFMFL